MKHPARGLTILLGGWLCFAFGCQATGMTGTPPASVRGLEDRAVRLLLDAAQRDDLGPPQANAIEGLVRVAPDLGAPAFLKALDSDIPLIRYAGCVALGEMRNRSARPRMTQMLNDPEPRVRLGAAFALCRMGDSRPGRLLADVMSGNADESMRADAAYLVGRIGDPKALKRLQLAENREKSTRVLLHLYTAMALLGDERAVDLLINSAQGDTISRLLALQGLEEVRSPRAVQALRYRFNDEQDYIQTRLIAARAMGRLGLKEGYDLAVRSLSRNEDNPVETGRIRANAALTLGAIGDRRALPMLQSLAESESDPATQIAACTAICEIINPRRR